MTREEIAVLVAFLVTTAKSDKTAPPNWLLDNLLQAVEKFVIHSLKEPLIFADICRKAAQSTLVTDPAATLLLRLGEINGLRRVAATTEEVARVKILSADVRAEIEAMLNCPRKLRLMSFWSYQHGVFTTRCGLYAEAETCQRRAFAMTTDPAQCAIASFLAIVYGLWHRLTYAETQDIISSELNILVIKYRKLELDVKSTAYEAQWGLGNGPIHILQAYVWAWLPIPNGLWNELYGKVQEAASEIPAFSEWAKLFGAVDGLRGEKMEMKQRGYESAVQCAACSADPTVIATAKLLQARYLYNFAADDMARALALYAEIQPGPDCHHVAAVAARELATLTM